MATVLGFVRLPVRPDGVDPFTKLVERYLSDIRSAPGALWADVAEAADDEPSFILVSEWRTVADLDAWESGEVAARFTDESDVLLRGDVTRRRFSGEA